MGYFLAVNNWEIPKTQLAKEEVKDAGKITEFYQGEANAGSD